MRMFSKMTQLGLISLGALTLAACGSGSGGGGSNNSGGTPPLTGVFIDGPVQGVRYQTATESGLTNTDGEFNYQPGETVSFSLGGIDLGSASGADEINPFDLVGLTPPTTVRELNAEFEKSDQVTDFNRVLNMAYLLVLLDNDQDPDNGLDLTNWNTDLANETLDINQSADAFEQRFYYLLQRFAIYERRDNRDEGFALNHLYQSLNIQVDVSLLQSVSGDNGNDGTVNWMINYQRDDLGRVTLYGEDRDADSDNEYTQVSAFFGDSLDRRTLSRREEDNNNDGIIDEVKNSTTSYDDNYNYLTSLTESDYNNDGVIDYRNSDVRDYAADGSTRTSRRETDEDGDGPNPISNIEVETSTYDENGNQLTTRRETDEDGDGNVDSVTMQTQSFDDNNNYLGQYEERDEDNDGTIDNIQESVLTYDSNGRQLSRERRSDYDADQVFDNIDITEYSYDSSGRLIAEHNLGDGDADGNIDSFRNTDYVFDDNGNLLSEIRSEDSDADGPNLVGTNSIFYTYNDSNQRLTKATEEDRDGDGAIERSVLETYAYDSSGNISSLVSVRDNDGEGPGTNGYKVSTTYMYNASGDLVQEQQDYDYQNDGGLDRRFTRETTFSSDGQILSDLETNDADGEGPNPETTNYYEYTYQSVPNALEVFLQNRYFTKRPRYNNDD